MVYTESSVYVTSDTHFGHENIIKHCERPFKNAKEMDEYIIEKWNSIVPENAYVFHLGDFVFRNSASIDYYVSALNGHISVILGNHDDFQELYKCKKIRVYHGSYVLKYINKELYPKKVFLSHYPHISWNGSRRKVPHLFGHMHLRKGVSAETFPWQERAYEVGMDLNNLSPLKLEDAINFAKNNPYKQNMETKWENIR